MEAARMLLPIHIAAGGLAIVLRRHRSARRKGGTIHRRSGLLFVYAMLVMGTSASILGLRHGPTDGNVMAGFLTAYFVVTGLTTVRPTSPWTRGINAAALHSRLDSRSSPSREASRPSTALASLPTASRFARLV